MAGTTGPRFPATPGAFGEHPPQLPALSSQGGGSSSGIMHLSSGLNSLLAATYFGSPCGTAHVGITTDAAGNLYLGGSTAPRGLPTVTPLAQGFGSPGTGYVAKISGDLSTLLFSGYFGDNENFSVGSVSIGRDGALILGGATTLTGTSTSPGNVWLNSIDMSSPPALRVDSVVNAASLQAEPLSGGETILVRGAGFTTNSRVLLGDTVLPTIAANASTITATVPKDFSGTYTFVQVQSGTAASNTVLVPVTSTSPGLFSQDGTMNSPAHPADYGERITILATGVGTVPGFPGDVHQLTVYVPTRARITAVNPDLANFKFPAQSGMVLKIGTAPARTGSPSPSLPDTQEMPSLKAPPSKFPSPRYEGDDPGKPAKLSVSHFL